MSSDDRHEFYEHLSTKNMNRLLLASALIFVGEVIAMVSRLLSNINYFQSGSLFLITFYKFGYSLVFVIIYFFCFRAKNKNPKVIRVINLLFITAFLAIQLHMAQYEFSTRGMLNNYIYGLMMLLLAVVITNYESAFFHIAYTGLLLGAMVLYSPERTDFRSINFVVITSLVAYVASRMYYYSTLQNFLSHKALTSTNKRLEDLSMRDHLTKINNRHGFYKDFELIWSQASRQNAQVAFMLADIDKFKNYNDYYGHVAGDKCLADIANCLKNIFGRRSDCIGRYGGEEFIAVISFTDKAQAVEQADRFIKAVEALQIEHVRSPILPVVTISAGVYLCTASKESSSDSCIRKADAALYMAKDAGGNQNVMQEDEDGII